MEIELLNSATNNLSNKSSILEGSGEEEKNNSSYKNKALNQIKDINDNKDNFTEESNKFLKKIQEVSDAIKQNDEELNKIYEKFKESEIKLYKDISIYKYCTCKHCCKYCFCLCLTCCKKNDEDYNRLDLINQKFEEIENYNIKAIESYNKENNCCKFSCYGLIILFYFLSFFHYFGLSEIDAISSAVLKEIFRTIKCYIQDHYVFDDGIIRDFSYYLTDSNYHDSSQINFNYMFSFLSLYLINCFKNKYNLETTIVYSVSISIIFLFLLSWIPHNYLSKEDIIKGYNYGGLELTFYYIIPYIIIYLCSGFISLLPHKILDEFIKKNNITKFGAIVGLRIVINLIMGLSVVAKNFFNYNIIVNYHYNTIKKILW